MPLSLYLAGAGAAVALSFVVMALFIHDPARVASYPRLKLLAPARMLARSPAVQVARALSVAAFVLILAAGLFGAQDRFANIAPILVWVIWWVGLAYVSALLGNLWALINPWEIMFSWAEALYRRSHRDSRLSLSSAYPRRLGAWPAVVLFLVFAWIELIYDEAEVPARLALLILAYSLLTWMGMVAFGKREWLRRGEVFPSSSACSPDSGPWRGGGKIRRAAGSATSACAAVYLAHAMALRVCREPRNALRSQYPMLVLMRGLYDDQPVDPVPTRGRDRRDLEHRASPLGTSWPAHRALQPAQLAMRYILLCVARPLSDCKDRGRLRKPAPALRQSIQDRQAVTVRSHQPSRKATS